MRIVVLDPDKSQTDLICQVLTSAGHVCHGFQTGKDLLAHVRKDSYDMLILDWQVGDMDGADVVRKAREKLPENAPVMFMTTSSGEDDIVAGLGAGASPRELLELGARRVSLGGTIARSALALVRRAAEELYDFGTIRFAKDQIPQAELNRIYTEAAGRRTTGAT
jgi:DNA-binding response OmpR family regulator